jgi:DNA polymerase III epsilon subunit family exonuclease
VNEQSLAATTFVIVDLETTGGSPRNGCAITEIGAVKVRGGQLLGELQSFVNPLSPIPEYITSLTGITNEMVATSPIIDEALPAFIEFCGSDLGTVLVAHNAPFDLGFLRAAAEEIEMPWPDYRVIDTARLARIVLGRDEVPNCKLGTLALFFNTDVKPTHRALDDAQTTTEILHHLFERFGSLGVTTIESLIKTGSKKIKRPRYVEHQVHWQIKEEFVEYKAREEEF